MTDPRFNIRRKKHNKKFNTQNISLNDSIDIIDNPKFFFKDFRLYCSVFLNKWRGLEGNTYRLYARYKIISNMMIK